MHPRFDKLKTPPIIGEIYRVLCFKTYQFDSRFYLTPVYNHLHDDKENGQHYKHYHADSRFELRPKDEKKYILGGDPRIWGGELQIFKRVYVSLIFKKFNETSVTSNSLISKSKVKGKLCVGMKCPHKGYDLSKEVGTKKFIVCPLHGTKINKESMRAI